MWASPADGISVLVQDLGILLGFVALTALLKPERASDRFIFGTLTGAIIVTYLVWRWRDTLPRMEPSFESLWPYIFFSFEAVAVTYTLLSIVILMRRSDRSADADVSEPLLSQPGNWPAVDVFICTYNEPLDVVEKSILPALAMDYGRKTIWVLDDTRRSWLKDYCDDVGARYVTRADNQGAKAGNLNNGLKISATEDGGAPLVLVLDGDFAPLPNLLKRMVGLFEDPKVAVVQSPQFFYNADPIQHNLHATKSWVDDQRIFFDVFQPAKDAWDCAFCVGTSFIVRRDRLAEIGGFPQEAICEDLNLTYSLMRGGYKTRWLNERLSVGLSAEGLPEYVTQRTRWCLGTIQVALLKNGPLRGPGYSIIERVQFFHGVLNWLCKPFIVLMLVAPAVYWFAGLPAFHADYLSFLRYGLPTLLALWSYNGWVSRSRTLPIFMEVTHTITALAVTITLLTAIVRPFGRPFKVTDKGGDRSGMVVRWRMASLFGGMSLLSAGSILWAYIGPSAPSEVSPLDYFNLIWAGISMFFTFVAFLVCFELPRYETSFAMKLPTYIRSGSLTYQATISHLSLSGGTAQLADACELASPDEFWMVELPSGWVSAKTLSCIRGTVTFQMTLDGEARRKLLLFLFSQPMPDIAASANMRGALKGLFRRAFVFD